MLEGELSDVAEPCGLSQGGHKGLQPVTDVHPVSCPLLPSMPLYLSVEHHCSPVVLLFLQNEDNVSWQHLQLLVGLGDELVQNAVRLPFEGPGRGSSGPVRKAGYVIALLRTETQTSAPLVLQAAPSSP